MCHHRCAFKLYGEVNSVKKHNYKIWLNDDEISTSPRGLGTLYKTLLARKFSEPEDGRYRPKHEVFSLANKHHHLAIFYSCVFDWIHLSIQFASSCWVSSSRQFQIHNSSITQPQILWDADGIVKYMNNDAHSELTYNIARLWGKRQDERSATVTQKLLGLGTNAIQVTVKRNL